MASTLTTLYTAQASHNVSTGRDEFVVTGDQTTVFPVGYYIGFITSQGSVVYKSTIASTTYSAGSGSTTVTVSTTGTSGPAYGPSGSYQIFAARYAPTNVITYAQNPNLVGSSSYCYVQDVSVQGGIAQSIRTRVTTANVNAGATLLPAVVGRKYRLIDCTLIAVGGSASAATAVVINGVQSTSTVALVSAAVAALTQSAVVKPDTTNVTVLADGASFAQCDANTAITIAKTGSSLATATAIDVILTYDLSA